jgi:uncharacterized protein YbaP (TraB family)
MKPASMRNLLSGITLLYCIAFSPDSHADSDGHALPLWTLNGASNRVYLLGSVHMLRESDHPLPAAIYDAYADAEALIMELDVSAVDPIASQAMIKELGMIGDGRNLGDWLGPEDFAEAQRLADRANIPLSMLAGAEPWFAAITIDSLMLMRFGFTPADGIEMRFAESAAKDGKPIAGLETERQQLEMLDGLSVAAQRDLLMQTLIESEDAAQSMNSLVAAWRNGDTAFLEGTLLEEIRSYPEIYQTIVVRRNENWLNAIIGLLDDSDDYLVIVGAMHMIGDSGVPELLRAKGYVVDQLQQVD